MRRSDRELRSWEEKMAVLARCRILRVALCDDEGLYLVPLSFGYRAEGNRLTLYLHSAQAGRKVDAFRRGCSVAFETDCDVALRPGATPCSYSCTYKSLTGTGVVSELTDSGEKAAALEEILRCQTGQTHTVTEAMAQSTAVFAITVTALSGKARL